MRLYVIRAYDLKKADINLLGHGSSDPYVKISGCGSKEYTTKVINNNLNPVWNEVFHITLDDLEGSSKLQLNVYDKDIKTDDFIGS